MRTMASVALVLLLSFAAWSAYRLQVRLIGDAEKASALQGKNDKVELKAENFAAIVTRAQELAGLP